MEKILSIVNDHNREKLLANSHVESLTNKQIVYTEQFMLNGLKAYQSGIPAPQVWIDAGFELKYFKKGYFQKCISRWKNQYQDGKIIPLTRGRKHILFSSDQEEIAFLKAENALLKELRALGLKGTITGSIISLELFKKTQASQLPFCVASVELVAPGFIAGLRDLIEN